MYMHAPPNVLQGRACNHTGVHMDTYKYTWCPRDIYCQVCMNEGTKEANKTNRTATDD